MIGFLLTLWAIVGLVLFYEVKGSNTDNNFKSVYHQWIMYILGGPAIWALAAFFALTKFIDLGAEGLKPEYDKLATELRKVFFT